MDDLKFVFAGEDSELQRNSVPMLARCFEEWQIFQAEYGNSFPFREISFIAQNNDGEIVGHVGIMPFAASDGQGNFCKIAGIASVGTAPEYRKRGIAAKLCSNAAAWAQNNGFDCLVLYTAFFHVYESCGWKIFPMQSCGLENENFEPQAGRKGMALSDAEKDFIIECYNSMADFPGKVVRHNDRNFHDWKRIFREQFFDWYVNENGYAAAFEGVLAEFRALNPDGIKLCRNMKTAFLPENFPDIEQLYADGWKKRSVNDAPDCWHGEKVMLRNINSVPQNIFFSLVDKF